MDSLPEAGVFDIGCVVLTSLDDNMLHHVEGELASILFLALVCSAFAQRWIWSGCAWNRYPRAISLISNFLLAVVDSPSLMRWCQGGL